MNIETLGDMTLVKTKSLDMKPLNIGNPHKDKHLTDKEVIMAIFPLWE